MIPKIIHYCWLGRNPKPKSVLKCIDSWKKYCPDYKIIEWNEDNLDFENAPAFVRQAYDAKAWGFVPDYFRLWIIYTYGGIYLDTDVQVIKSFNPLLANHAFAGFEIDTSVALGLGFGAEKNNDMIKEHLELYSNIHFVNADGSLNRVPSPQITTNWLVMKGLRLDGSPQDINELRIYPKDYFAPKSFDTGESHITKNTFSIHQYDASWFSEDEQIQRKTDLRKYRIQKITKLPNRILIGLLGSERYDKLKLKLKQ